ncbi:MAG: GntR family transcriptional regulator [Planctomycetota bacterium]
MKSPDSTATLHRKLRDILRGEIFTGAIRDGATLPPERDLATSYNMSRVTVRKTLGLLAAENILSREQGRGTIHRARTGGFSTDMARIAVVAPATSPFFAAFVRHFAALTEKNGSLVIFQPSDGDPASRPEDILFRLLLRDIRNFILWPRGESVDTSALGRIRGLGANIVLFDRVISPAAADCVSVDNADAIATLLEYLRGRKRKDITYVGWDRFPVSSNLEREAAFRRIAGPDGIVRNIPWREERGTDADIAALLARLRTGGRMPGAFVGGNGNIGISLARALRAEPAGAAEIVCVDDLPGATELNLTVYDQPMERLAARAYSCLVDQNRKVGAWRPRTFRLKGTLIRR